MRHSTRCALIYRVNSRNKHVIIAIGRDAEATVVVKVCFLKAWFYIAQYQSRQQHRGFEPGLSIILIICLAIIIYTISLLMYVCLFVCLSVGVGQLQDAIVARSYREMSEIVRID